MQFCCVQKSILYVFIHCALKISSYVIRMQLKVTMLLKTQSFMYIFTVHRKPTALLREDKQLNVTVLFKTQSFVYVFTVHRKPTAMLRGHNAPIFFLHIADDDDRIYSLSTDRSLKVDSPRQPPQLRFGGEEGAGHDSTGTRVLPVLCVSLNKVK